MNKEVSLDVLCMLRQAVKMDDTKQICPLLGIFAMEALQRWLI